MAEVFLPLVNPQDLSEPGPGGAAPLGGLLGNGDLTSEDGDATGLEAWNNSATNYEATLGIYTGTDVFRYDVPQLSIPTGAVITAVYLEASTRAVEHAPQGAALLRLSLKFGPALNAAMWVTSGDTSFTYSRRSSDDLLVQYPDSVEEIRQGLRDGACVVTLACDERNSADTYVAGVRVTLAGVRVVYELAARHRPHNRIVQRGNDGLGLTGGQRVVQRRTIQASNRAFGIR